MNVTCICPRCGGQNSAFSSVILANEEVGAELWGRCGTCDGEFRIMRATTSESDTEVTAYRSPVVTTVLYRLSCGVS